MKVLKLILISASFALASCSINGSQSGRLTTHIFQFKPSPKLEKTDPSAFAGRITDPKRVIELYRHKESPHSFVAFTGKRVTRDFDLLLKAPAKTIVGIMRELMPDVKQTSVQHLNNGHLKFLLFKLVISHNGQDWRYYDFITQENLDQYHIHVSYPINTPPQQVKDLLSVVESLEVKR